MCFKLKRRLDLAKVSLANNLYLFALKYALKRAYWYAKMDKLKPIWLEQNLTSHKKICKIEIKLFNIYYNFTLLCSAPILTYLPFLIIKKYIYIKSLFHFFYLLIYFFF